MQKPAGEAFKGVYSAASRWTNYRLPRSDIRTDSIQIGKLSAISQPCIKLNTWSALCRYSLPSTPEAVAYFFFLSAIRNTTCRPFLCSSSGFRMFYADESHAPTAPSFRYSEASLEGRSLNLLIRAHHCLSPSSKNKSSSLLGWWSKLH
jgi:hypothetical protein